MKRCPECRRDHYDDSLLYCLDDGAALLEGPGSGNEPATALLQVPPTSEPSAIQTQIYYADAVPLGDLGTAPVQTDSFSATKAPDNTDLAVVFVGLNHKDKAFEELERAFAQRSFPVRSLNTDPLFDSVHDDPRWKDLQRRLGIPE